LVSLSKCVDDEKGQKFEFLANVVLYESCKSHGMPPINWYFLMTTLLKSKYNSRKQVETRLVQLTLAQTSSSAGTLLKNLLVDTAHFQQLAHETQLVIAGSLSTLARRLGTKLFRKFLRSRLAPGSLRKELVPQVYASLLEYFKTTATADD